MNKDKVIIVRGVLHWAKIVGKARPYTGNPKFDKGPLWQVDITPDKPSLQKLKAAGILDKLREPKDNDSRKEKYLSLSILENKADGSKNNPPVIQDASGGDWPEGKLIGNGSVADIMIKVKDYGTTVGAYYQKARILDLIPFGGNDFEPLSKEDEFFAKREAKGSGEDAEISEDKAFSSDDLDEDIPF